MSRELKREIASTLLGLVFVAVVLGAAWCLSAAATGLLFEVTR